MSAEKAQGIGPEATAPGVSLDEKLAKINVVRLFAVKGVGDHLGIVLEKDGKLHAQMCGAPSGSTNAYLIPKDDLPQAVAQGYIQAK